MIDARARTVAIMEAPQVAPEEDLTLRSEATSPLDFGVESAGVEGNASEDCILVIDDSSFLRSVLKDTLEGAGYQVALVGDWRGAAGVLKTVRPRLVLLDIGLPDVQGDDACAVLKHGGRNQDLPVYLMSSGTDAALKAKAEASGADGYLRKPFTPVHILGWLRDNHCPPNQESAEAKPSLLERVTQPEDLDPGIEPPEAILAAKVAPSPAAPPSLPGEPSLPPPGQARDEAIKILELQLLNPDPALQAQAAYLLGQAQHKSALARIRVLLRSDNAGVVSDSLFAIGEMKDVKAIGEIEKLLKDSEKAVFQDLNVRLRAVEALGKIGDPRAFKTIALCMEGDRPKDERIVAIQALADLGDESVQSDLQRLMFEDDEVIQQCALKALDQIRGRTDPNYKAAVTLESEPAPEPESEAVSEPEVDPETSSSVSGWGDDLDDLLDGGGLDSLPSAKPVED
jgi:CheY-like chemotaxis protein